MHPLLRGEAGVATEKTLGATGGRGENPLIPMIGCGGYVSSEVDEEYEKLVLRMNPPKVTMDNTSCERATLVKVDSANKQGSLLEVVQVLTDLKLTIKRAYISSDGEWFMDVFHVVDQDGNKLSDHGVVDRIEQSLEARALAHQSIRRSVGVQAAAKHTPIELLGRDRPGLLSEIFAVLTGLKCNIVAAQVWTHNSRMASVVYVTDDATGAPINDSERLSKIGRLLKYVLRGNRDIQSAKSAIFEESTHAERRLHQMMMFADQQCVAGEGGMAGGDDGKSRPAVTVENCVEKEYTVVTVRSRDRPKLLFDTVCTLTDMQYVVFHATVIVQGPEAYQEYYIRKADGLAATSAAERTRLANCLEAAIGRRTAEGLRLELCCEDRVGLLSDVTRIFRENGLSVIQAEVSTRGSQAVNTFYVVDASGKPVESHMIDAVRGEIGNAILQVKDAAAAGAAGGAANSSFWPQEDGSRKFSFGELLRSRSEKLLYSLGLTRSSS